MEKFGKENKNNSQKMSIDTIVKLSMVGLIAIMVIAMILNMFLGSSGSTMSAMGGAMGVGRGNASAGDGTVTVSIKEIQSETIQEQVRISGDVSSKTETGVYPETSGKITRIIRDAGEQVARGDVIAYVDASRPGSSFPESPIVAPISGTVVAMNVNLGDTITTTTEVAKVGQLTDLEVTVFVAEKYANYLEEGLPAYIELSAAPGELFEARITQVSPVVNSTNRTIETKLEFINLDSRIKPGMYGNINLVVQEAQNTFVVPKDAIKLVGSEESVFVMEDNKAKRVMVETGLENDTDVQIISGLNEGDVVITVGAVTEGSAVRVAGTIVTETQDRPEGTPPEGERPEGALAN